MIGWASRLRIVGSTTLLIATDGLQNDDNSRVIDSNIPYSLVHSHQNTSCTRSRRVDTTGRSTSFRSDMRTTATRPTTRNSDHGHKSRCEYEQRRHRDTRIADHCGRWWDGALDDRHWGRCRRRHQHECNSRRSHIGQLLVVQSKFPCSHTRRHCCNDDPMSARWLDIDLQ